MFKFLKQKNKKNSSGFTQHHLSIGKSGAGFTIIETMIAISIFLVVVTVGMSSLLNASSIYKRSQYVRSEIDNLTFIMDEMSKNLRTGNNYVCIPNPYQGEHPVDCSNAVGISFTPASSPGGKWVYQIYGEVMAKSVDGINFIDLNSSDQVRLDTGSGFSLFGSGQTSGQQPFVVIKLSGFIEYNNTSIPFSIETGVSQRSLNFPSSTPTP